MPTKPGQTLTLPFINSNQLLTHSAQVLLEAIQREPSPLQKETARSKYKPLHLFAYYLTTDINFESMPSQ